MDIKKIIFASTICVVSPLILFVVVIIGGIAGCSKDGGNQPEKSGPVARPNLKTGVDTSVTENTSNESLTREPKIVNLTKYVVSYTGSQSYPKKYPLSLLFDEDLNTAWNTKYDNSQPAPWIEIVLDKPRKINHIHLTSGWQKINKRGEDLFDLNGSIKSFEVIFDGKPVLTYHTPAAARLMNTERIGKDAKTIRLVFNHIYPGQRWNDIALSELTIFGNIVSDSVQNADGPR